MAKLYAHMPETVFTKEAELGGEERCLANFVDFIGEGRGSQALGRALVETVRRVDALREELNGLRRSREKMFQAPPVEWIEERLAQMKQVLERRTEHSAVLLRSILGKIRLLIGSPSATGRSIGAPVNGRSSAAPTGHAQGARPQSVTRAQARHPISR